MTYDALVNKLLALQMGDQQLHIRKLERERRWTCVDDTPAPVGQRVLAWDGHEITIATGGEMTTHTHWLALPASPDEFRELTFDSELFNAVFPPLGKTKPKGKR